jgi:hypothetical protein
VGKIKNAYNILVGKSEGERTLGVSRRWCEDNIKDNLEDNDVAFLGYDAV